jgi:hypothetical protein
MSRFRRPRAFLIPAFWVLGGAAALWLLFGHGFVQYDTFYPLVWGHELAHGQTPDYSAALAPTPHPLATLAGLLLSPLGDGAATVVLALAFVSIAAIGYLTYRLGQIWFNRWVGLAAAAIILTREPLLSDGVRAYVDIPYVALVLLALVVESRRPRAGWPVLALLGVAGLLRPEAWLLSGAYVLYLALERDPAASGFRLRRRRDTSAGDLGWMVAIAAVAPVLWGLSDLLITGNPAHSFSGTRDTVETLRRDTGPVKAVLLGPRRLGEILREPGLLGAAGGLVLALALLRRRVLLGAAVVVVSGLAFFLVASAGLAVITRYLLLTATLLTIFCGVAIFGWLLLPQGHPWENRWIGFAIVVALAFVAFTPSQRDRLSNLHSSIATQQRILDDLHDLADSGAFAGRCGPVAVPNHRPVPFLALWLDQRPSRIVDAQLERPIRGYFVQPASRFVERNFTLDPNDPRRLTARVPPGFRLAAQNRSWKLYARCPRA